MRTSQRVSKQLRAASKQVSRQVSRRVSQAKAMITPIVAPVITSIKRRFSNKNKILMSLAGISACLAGLGVGYMGVKMYKNTRDTLKYVERIDDRTRNIHTNVTLIEHTMKKEMFLKKISRMSLEILQLYESLHDSQQNALIYIPDKDIEKTIRFYAKKE